MRFQPIVRRFALLVLPLLATSCTESDPAREPPPLDTVAADAKPVQRFMLARLDVPALSSENDALSFDLDGDPRHRHDNKLGTVLQLVAANLATDAQDRVDEDALAGRLAVVVDVHADGLVDQPDVAIVIRLGVRDASGIGPAPGQQVAPIYGYIEDGRFITQQAGGARLPLSLLAGSPVDVDLIAARVSARISERGVTEVVLGGGILGSQLVAVHEPAIFRLIAEEVADDPSSARAALLRQLLDTDKDGTITEQEFLHSNIVNTVLSLDVDLVKNGVLPTLVLGQDGVDDAFSVGVGLVLTPARPATR